MSRDTKQGIYLASSSPRRAALLQQLGVPLQRIHAPVDEAWHHGEAAEAYTERLALSKAAAGWQVVCNEGLPSRPLLAADTTVAFQNEIFGKPCDAAEAYRMLRTLSGQCHRVISSVVVRQDDKIRLSTSISEVSFKLLSEEEITRYLASGEPFDKAGAYGIQGIAGVFVERIEGSFSGIMGLPVFETAALLREFGYVFP